MRKMQQKNDENSQKISAQAEANSADTSGHGQPGQSPRDPGPNGNAPALAAKDASVAGGEDTTTGDGPSTGKGGLTPGQRVTVHGRWHSGPGTVVRTTKSGLSAYIRLDHEQRPR